MHSPQAERHTPCAACEDSVSAAERAYRFGEGQVLCCRCALERGGIFDERFAYWARQPDVGDLLPRPDDA